MKKTTLFVSLSLIMSPIFGADTSLSGSSWNNESELKKAVKPSGPTAAQQAEMNEIANGNFTGKPLTAQQIQDQNNLIEGARSHANNLGNSNRTSSLKVDNNGQTKILQYNGLDVYEFEQLPISKGKTTVTMIPKTEPYRDANGNIVRIYVLLNNGTYSLRDKPNPSAPTIYDPNTKLPIMVEKLVPVYDREGVDAGTSIKNNRNNANTLQGQLNSENQVETSGQVKISDSGSGGAILKSTRLMQGLTLQADFMNNVYSGFKWTSAGLTLWVDKVDMNSLSKTTGTNNVATLYGKICGAGLSGGMCECDPLADYAKKDPNFCTAFDNAVLAGKVWKNVTLQNNGNGYHVFFDANEAELSLKCPNSTTNKNVCDIAVKMTADNRVLDAATTNSPHSYGGDNSFTHLTDAQQSKDMTDGINGSASVLKKCMANAQGAVDNPDPNTGNVSSVDTCGTETEFKKTVGSPDGTQSASNSNQCTMQPKSTTTKKSSATKTCTREWDAVYHTCDNFVKNTVCNVSRVVNPKPYKCNYTTVNTTTTNNVVSIVPVLDPITKQPVIDPITNKPKTTTQVTPTVTSSTTDSGCESYRDEQALGYSEPDIFGCTMVSNNMISSVPVTTNTGGPTPPNNSTSTVVTTTQYAREYSCYDRNVQSTEQVSGPNCTANDLLSAVKTDDGEKIWMFSHPAKTQSECIQMGGNYKVGCVQWERAYVWPSQVTQSNCRTTALNNPKVTGLAGPAATSCINGGLGEISTCNGWFRRKTWKTSWDMSNANPNRPYYGAGCYLSYTDFDPVENTTLQLIHHISQMDGNLGDPKIGNANGCGYCTTAEVTDICYGDRALDRGTCANEIDPLLAGSDPQITCTLSKVTPNTVFEVGGKTGVFAQTETYTCVKSEQQVTEWERVCPSNTPLGLGQGITKGTDNVKQPVAQDDASLAQLAVASEMADAQGKAQKKADASDITNRQAGDVGTSGGTMPMGDIKPMLFVGQDMRCEYPKGSMVSALYNNCCSEDLRRTGGKKMFGKCNEGHVQLAANKRAKRTVEVGERCSVKKKFMGCIEKQRTYCSFDSMFSRIIQQQGRIQLGKIVANAVAGVSAQQVQMPFYTTTPAGMTDQYVEQIYAGDLVITNNADKKGEWIPNAVSLLDENVSFYKWPWYCSKENWKKLETLDGFASCPSDLTLYMASCSKNCGSATLPIDPFQGTEEQSPFKILSTNAINNDIKTVSDRILIAGGCDTSTATCNLDVKITKPAGAQAYTYKTISWDWSAKDDANAVVVSGGATQATGGQILDTEKSAVISDKMNNVGDYLIRPYIENYALDPNNLPKVVKVKYSADAGNTWQDINLPTDFNKEQVLTTVNQLGNPALSQQELQLNSAFSVVEGKCNYDNNQCSFRVKALITVQPKGWGDADNPDCTGLTPTQMSVIDMNAMDLSEWQQDIMSKMKMDANSFSTSTRQQMIQQNMKAQMGTMASVFDNDNNKVSTLNNEKAYVSANSKQTQVASISNRELWIQTGRTETVSMRIAGNYPQWNVKADGTMNVDPSTKQLIPDDPISRIEVDWGDCSTPTTITIPEAQLSPNPSVREQQIQSNIVKINQIGANIPMSIAPKDAQVYQNEINMGNYYIGTGYLTAHTYGSGVDWLTASWPATCTNKPVQKKAATDNYQANIYYWEVPVSIKLWTKSTADKAALFGRAEQPYEIIALIANYQDDLVEKHNIQGDTKFRLKEDSQNQQSNVTGSDAKKANNRDLYQDVTKPYTCYGSSC